MSIYESSSAPKTPLINTSVAHSAIVLARFNKPSASLMRLSITATSSTSRKRSAIDKPGSASVRTHLLAYRKPALRHNHLYHPYFDNDLQLHPITTSSNA
ncbi:hypothetical protein SeMB42_g01019 [Synchytrium endobioticum]|uniref:Uncharacterized protein n=1 Tax=Synchytrium endobioticum TaxID=286115 RepID=A0A507DMW0_9FUNG|nr:hypothetical protein SeMB42_g01019 [Synchytrium endobioticum]